MIIFNAVLVVSGFMYPREMFLILPSKSPFPALPRFISPPEKLMHQTRISNRYSYFHVLHSSRVLHSSNVSYLFPSVTTSQLVEVKQLPTVLNANKGGSWGGGGVGGMGWRFATLSTPPLNPLQCQLRCLGSSGTLNIFH